LDDSLEGDDEFGDGGGIDWDGDGLTMGWRWIGDGLATDRRGGAWRCDSSGAGSSQLPRPLILNTVAAVELELLTLPTAVPFLPNPDRSLVGSGLRRRRKDTTG